MTEFFRTKRSEIMLYNTQYIMLEFKANFLSFFNDTL
jgi:hypothetical protein